MEFGIGGIPWLKRQPNQESIIALLGISLGGWTKDIGYKPLTFTLSSPSKSNTGWAHEISLTGTAYLSRISQRERRNFLP